MKQWLSPALGLLGCGLIIYGCQTKKDPNPDGSAGSAGTADTSAGSSSMAGSDNDGHGGEPGAQAGAAGAANGGAGNETSAAGAGGETVQGGATGAAGDTSPGGMPPVVEPPCPAATTVWKEDFEADAPDWGVTGGVWAIGKPTNVAGPTAFAGMQVAGTGLAADYAANQDAWLTSPEIPVPAAKEHPRFRFKYWYELAAGDAGYVYVRVKGGNWQLLSTLTQSGDAAWRQTVYNLESYADQTVQFGFRLLSNGASAAPGLFVDEAAFETGSRCFTKNQGFENDWDNWSTYGGVWAIGKPTAADGPEPFEGKALAGTILSGDYQANIDSWLVSPIIDVPSAKEEPRVSFKSWYGLTSGDAGYVYVRADGGNWQLLSTLTDSGDGAWYNTTFPLNAYANRSVELGFRLLTNGQTFGPGFYIDDFQYQTGAPALTNPQGFEDGWAGWSVYNGVWAIGAPTAAAGPTPHSGTAVAGTVLSGDYDPDHDGWLISPRFVVPKDSTNPSAAYWYWYELAAGDAGYAYLRVDGGNWQLIDTLTDSGGSVWRQKKIDLTAYKDHVVELGYRLLTNGAANTLGYYIDDVTFSLK